MKNLSKTIAAISLSLLTVGAMAQTPANTSKAKKTTPTLAKGKFITSPATHSTHKSSVVIGSFLADNLNADEVLSGNTIYNWSPYNFINSAFDNTDTLTSYCANSVTGVFDTLWDFYSQAYVAPQAGSASVDTITCFVHYFNSSGNNDTIFLWVKSVTAQGFPGNTTYGIDTVVVTPGTTFFPNNNIDSIQSFSVIKTIAIPAGARHGWNFSVKMSVHCDKTMDSIAIAYYSEGTNVCGALGGYYCNSPTIIGVFDSAVAHVNTFETGLWAFNSPGNHGDGTSLSWPQLTSPYMGYYMNAGGYYFAPLPLTLVTSGACTDTAQFVIQDVAIFPSINGVDASGVSNIANNGLSVGQNYPNPFNKETTINYSLTKSSDVTFTVYDITGRIIANNNYGSVVAGQHTINLSANTFSPGIYFYTFNVNGSTVTKKMVITE